MLFITPDAGAYIGPLADDCIKFVYDEEENYSISSNIVGLSMMGTGVYKLFTREDFHDLFFRMAILYRSEGIVEHFFQDHYLFEVTKNNHRETVFPLNIVRFLGAFKEFSTTNEPFESWLADLVDRLKGCVISSKLNGLSLFSGITGKNNLYYTSQPSEPEIRNARIFADRIVSEIPESVFKKWEKNFAPASEMHESVVQWQPRKNYDYEALDEAVKDKLTQHFVPYTDTNQDNTLLTKTLIHLSWFWANGYVFCENYQGSNLYWIKRGYRFDYAPLETENGVINLEMTKNKYHLEALFPLLKH